MILCISIVSVVIALLSFLMLNLKVILVLLLKLVVLEYQSIKTIDDTTYATVICKYSTDNVKDITYINNSYVVNKVLDEMNKILLSNEYLKQLLPQYSYNWMLYDDTKLSDTSAYKSLTMLDTIETIEYNEQVEFRY